MLTEFLSAEEIRDLTQRALRDAHDHVVYETQAEWLARHGSQAVTPDRPVQQELFA